MRGMKYGTDDTWNPLDGNTEWTATTASPQVGSPARGHNVPHPVFADLVTVMKLAVVLTE